MDDIRISNTLTIPSGELDWRFSRSGGPGGQHANTSATQVELRWNVRRSGAASDGHKALILDRLAGRIEGDGWLSVTNSETRSQHENRRRAAEQLQALVAGALKPRKKRKPTRPSRAAKERRLEQKRHQAEKKRRRKKPKWPR